MQSLAQGRGVQPFADGGDHIRDLAFEPGDAGQRVVLLPGLQSAPAYRSVFTIT
jgi:hypothetical protein